MDSKEIGFCVGRRHLICPSQRAAIRLFTPKAARPLSTQFLPFPLMTADAESCQSATAPLPVVPAQ